MRETEKNLYLRGKNIKTKKIKLEKKKGHFFVYRGKIKNMGITLK